MCHITQIREENVKCYLLEAPSSKSSNDNAYPDITAEIIKVKWRHCCGWICTEREEKGAKDMSGKIEDGLIIRMWKGDKEGIGKRVKEKEQCHKKHTIN